MQGAPKTGGLETAVKAAAAFGIGAYVIGLATTSLYLHRLDVTLPDPAALKARFALTGSVVIALAAISLAGLLVGDRLSRVRALDWLLRPRGASAVERRDGCGRRPGYVVAGLAASLSLMIFVFGTAKAFAWDDPDLYVHAVAAFLAAVVSALALLVTALAVTGRIERDYPAWTLFSMLAGITLVAVYLYVSFLAANLYPHLSQQFGGGGPKREQLVFRHDATREASLLGMNVTPAHPMSQPVTVIFHSDGSRAVMLSRDEVVEVSDSLIVGAVPAD
jgi:hypothetical protein